LTNVQRYQRPASLEDAWRLLQEGGECAKLVGGGVDVGRFAPPRVTTLIDLSKASRRSIVAGDEGLSIGAGATLSEVLESPNTTAYLDGILAAVLRQVASPLLRNAATVGGALASAHPWSDVLSLFLALDARVSVYAGQFRTQPLEELLAHRGEMDRAIIVDVLLPSASAPTVVGFEKFVRTGFDVGMLNCTCRLSVNEHGRCSDVRVVFGGTPDLSARSAAVEAILDGAVLDTQVIESAAHKAAEAIPARDDVRASGAYRRILATAGVRRCLARIAQRVGGEA
jgi:CO/xanthine dehydrogenase FAD-binding subunit